MEILLLVSIIILTTFFVVKTVFYSAKRNLFKGQAAWSGKDIKINHRKSEETKEFKKSDNYLNIIADESEFYLHDQSKQEEE
tara:strand:+ start:395 stop:640 length:246 start_codon:yes stop_codon:yes gene_type:complete